MNTITLDAPAHWASAIVNLDYSGLEKSDRAELNNWLLNNGLSFSDCLTCSDVSFFGQFEGKGCELLSYTWGAK